LSIGQRRRLHLGIAQLLENLYGNDASKFATDLAIHFEKGGDTASAIYYNLQVSQNSLRVFALDDALIHAQNAQRLIQQVVDEPKSVAWQIEAIIRIVETRYWKAEHKSALEMCDQGEKLCKKQSDFTEQHAYLLYWRSTILFEMGKFEDAVKVVKQAIRMLSSEPLRPRLQGYLYSRLGALYYVLPLQEVQQALDAALVIAEKHGLSDVKVKTLLQKAWVTFDRMGTPEETLLLCQEAIRIADENGMIPEQVICHELIAHANRRLKRGKEAFLHNQQAVMIARQGGLPNALHNALHGLALSWREVREDWQESLELLREALAIADDYHFHPSRFVIGRWFEVTFGLGMWSEAKRASDLLFKEHGDYFRVRGFYHKWRGHMLYASGRFEEAAKSYQEAIKIFKENSLVDEDESDFRSIQPNLGLALLEAGNLEEGIRYLEDASDYWEKRNDTRFTRSLRGLARASFLQEDFIQSLAYLHKALEITEGSYSDRAWPDWPQVCTDLAKVLLVTGNSDEALKHAIVSYKKYKKWGHFLLGEVAFIIGQILVYQDKQQDALPYLQEAQNEWRRINLTHYLPAWKNFMQEHDLI
jgi:tetratricopeptide (TPR) repeat protein